MCKLQTDVIVIILVVDLSKRGSLCINLCVLVQMLNFQVGAGGHLRFGPPKKNVGILGGTWGLFLLHIRFVEVESVIKTC